MSFLEQNKEFAKAKPFVTAVIVAAARMVQNRNAFMEKQPEKK